jgi:hypothetical protein
MYIPPFRDPLHIHVEWEGPLSYAQVLRLRNEDEDYGVYQVYGSHPVYGSDVLLYIGKADKQTLGKRLSQETWPEYNKDSERVAVYVGRLHTFNEIPNESKWCQQIALVERLLILAHRPAANSSGLNVSIGEELSHVHVLNWGKYRDLLPEVSGARYSTRFHTDEGYEIYIRRDDA